MATSAEGDDEPGLAALPGSLGLDAQPHRGPVADRAGELGEQFAGARRPRHRQQQHRRDEVAGWVVELGGELADRAARVLPRQPGRQALHLRTDRLRARSCRRRDRADDAVLGGQQVPQLLTPRCEGGDSLLFNLGAASLVGECPDGGVAAAGAGEAGDEPPRQQQRERAARRSRQRSAERGRPTRSVPPTRAGGPGDHAVDRGRPRRTRPDHRAVRRTAPRQCSSPLRDGTGTQPRRPQSQPARASRWRRADDRACRGTRAPPSSSPHSSVVLTRPSSSPVTSTIDVQ